MSFDYGVGSQFFLTTDAGISFSPPIGSTREANSTVVDQLLEKAQQLPSGQQALFSQRIYLVAGEIRAKISEMRKKGFSESEIERESRNLYSQLEIMGNRFLEKTLANRQKNLHAYTEAKDFDRRLQKIDINHPNFTVPPLSKTPSVMGLIGTARKLQDAVRASSQASQEYPTYSHSRTNVEHNMSLARAIGWTLKQIADGLHESCESTPQSKWLCQQGNDLGEGVMDATGLSQLKTEPNALPQTLRDLYGFDLDIGRQYSHDGLSAGILALTAAVPAGAGAALSRLRPIRTAGQQAYENYRNGIIQEKALVNRLDRQLPPIDKPAGYPANINQFYAQSDFQPFKATKLGSKGNGTMKINLLFKVFADEIFFLVRGRTVSSAIVEKTGTWELFESRNLYAAERLEHLAQQALGFAKGKNIKKANFAWDPDHHAFATSLQNASVEAVGKGTFSQGIHNKPLWVLKVNVPM